MATRFVNDKTTTFYKAGAGSARHGYLIFGDEVKTTGSASSGRIKATFRSSSGFISTAEIGTKAALEFYSIDVGQGDATFVVTPKRKKILVDGGLGLRALGFLVWKYRLDKPANSVDIDLMVLTHADGDHLKGLTPIMTHPQIHIKKIIHSGIGLFTSGHDTKIGSRNSSKKFLTTTHDSLAEIQGISGLNPAMIAWRDAVEAEGADYERVDSTTGLIDVGDPDVTLEIIGPRRESNGSYKWFDGRGAKHSHTINGHSVIFRLQFDEISFLFSGDLNIEGAEHLLEDATLEKKMDAHVLKSPHHGSHEFDNAFLEAVRPQISTISSGETPDYGHPRANFLGSLGLASRSSEPLIFSTELAATFVGDGDTADPEEGPDIDDLDFTSPVDNATARKRFKLMLPGIINIRTDGKSIWAARRISGGWESYGPIAPAPRPSVFNP